MQPTILSAAYLAALLAETEKAHKAFIDSIAKQYDDEFSARMALNLPSGAPGRNLKTIATDRSQAVADENARWAEWYGRYMATRIEADTRAENWQPVPTLDVPPFAPVVHDVVLSDAESSEIADDARIPASIAARAFAPDVANPNAA